MPRTAEGQGVALLCQIFIVVVLELHRESLHANFGDDYDKDIRYMMFTK